MAIEWYIMQLSKMKYHGLHINDKDNKLIKVRIANTDTRMGKSNGYRMIYYAIKQDEIPRFTY